MRCGFERENEGTWLWLRCVVSLIEISGAFVCGFVSVLSSSGFKTLLLGRLACCLDAIVLQTNHSSLTIYQILDLFGVL